MSPPLLISKLNACGLSELDDQGGDHPHDGGDQGGVDDDQDGCDDDGLLCFCIGNHFVQLFDVSGLFLVVVVPMFQCYCSNLSVDKQKESLIGIGVSDWRIVVDIVFVFVKACI